jgi:hypothetical protein
MLAGYARAAAPTYQLDLDIQKPMQEFALDVYQANTYTLQVNFKERGTPWTNTAYTATFKWGTNWLDSTSMSTTTGTVSGATATFSLGPTVTATNGEWLAEIVLVNGSEIRTWNQGWMKVHKSPGAGSPGALDFGTTVNWGTVDTYAGTSTNGPYRAGSNITFSANVDGSVDINGEAAATAYIAADNVLSNNLIANASATYLPLAGGTLVGPVTGTTATLSGGVLSTDYIQLDTSFSDGTAEGRLQWNSTDGTPEVGMPGGNVNLQIGQEQLMRVKNVGASAITNGEALAVVSASGNRPGVVKADADAGNPTNICDGVATENIAAGSTGYMCINGLVRGINTSGYSAEGVLLYLSTTAGVLSETRPSAPTDATIVGVVVTKATDGTILANVRQCKDWADLDARYAQPSITNNLANSYLLRSGVSNMTGNLDMNGNDITGLDDLTATSAQMDITAAARVKIMSQASSGGQLYLVGTNVASPRAQLYGEDGAEVIIYANGQSIGFGGSNVTASANSKAAQLADGTWDYRNNALSNVTKTVVSTTGTNVSMFTVYIAPSNYLAFVVAGSSTTNLLPLPY